MTAPTTIITSHTEIQELARILKGCSVIAFDTEFIRETTFYPIVEIIQIATEDQCWIVDAQAFKKGHPSGPPDPNKPGGVAGAFDPGIKPLLDIFEDQSILKVLHAAQGDQECLYTSFGVVASPTLDTAVAASFCGYGEAIGLSKLLKTVLDVSLTKGHARTNWSVRPLPAQLIEYAAADVAHLVLLGRTLLEQLEKLGRKKWALDASAKWENKSLYDLDVDAILQKLSRGGRIDKRTYAALHHLIQWREKRVRQLNLPRRWVADDAVLMDLARVRPKDLQHLAAFRGLNKGELKVSGETILEALRASPDESVPMPVKAPREPIPTIEEAQAVEVLRCFVGLLAEKHRISARHLLPAGPALELLRGNVKTKEELTSAGVLSQSALELIGEELLAFLRGKRALSVKDGVVQVINLASD